MLLMLKHLSARGSLLLFMRTHRQLEYFFNLTDTRGAANQDGISGPYGPPTAPNVIEIHPVARVRPQRSRQR